MKIGNKDTKERSYLFDGQSKSDPDDYIHDDLNVLVIYGDNSSFTKTVEEHLHSFKQYLPFNVYYANGVLDYNNISWLDDFDVIIIHYSLGLYHQNYASTNVLRDLKKSKAVKFVFAQDEYDNTNELIPFYRSTTKPLEIQASETTPVAQKLNPPTSQSFPHILAR